MNPCLTCARPDAPEINAALQVEPLRHVAKRFDLTLSSLHRHKEHIQKPAAGPNGLQNERDPEPERKPVLREIRGLAREARLVLRDAKKEGDLKARTQAIEGARKCLRDCAEITKELSRAPGVNLQITQQQALAVEHHHRLTSMQASDLLAQAGSCLADGLMRSDALALRILADLNRLRERQSVATVAE